jgi:hypothetical protein
VSYGFYNPLALALVVAAAVVSIAACLRDGAAPPWNGRHLLVAALVASCAWHVAMAPGWYVVPRTPGGFRALAVVALIAAASYAIPVPASLRKWRFALLTTCFVGMASAVVVASPLPRIDVWWFQQLAAAGFLRGQNPYQMTYPNVYGNEAFFGPGLVQGGRLVFFPYPPLTFLLEAPAVALLGDVRLELVLLTAASAVLLRRAAPTETGELSALVLLMQPRSFFVMEQAWTEPIVLLCFSIAVLAVTRPKRSGGWVLAGVAAGMLATSKQYAPLLLIPLFGAFARDRWRVGVVALAVIATIVLPFAAWDWRELWHDTVWAHFLQPFRMDTLSVLVPVAAAIGHPLSAAWGFAAAAVVLGAWSRRRSSIAHGACVAGTALLVFVLFNKQAHCNYYWLCAAVLLVAGALVSASDRGPAQNQEGSRLAAAVA